MKTCYRLIGLMVLILTLTGCGFALRQPENFAPALQTMSINTGSPNDPFVQTVRRALLANNVDVVDDAKNATSSLNILSIQTPNNMMSSGGITTSGFYTASLIVQFSVTDHKGAYLIQSNTLQQSQNFTSNATQVLSGNLTAAQLASQMDQTIAQMIIDQLAKVPQS